MPLSSINNSVGRPAHVQSVNRQTNYKVCVKNNCGFAVKELLLEQAFAGQKRCVWGCACRHMWSQLHFSQL